MRCTELINSETPDGLVWNQITDETNTGKHLPKKPDSKMLGHGRRRSSLKHCEVFLSFCVRAHTWETLAVFCSQLTHLWVSVLCAGTHCRVLWCVGAWGAACPTIWVYEPGYTQPAAGQPPLRLAAQGTLQDLLKVIII